MKPLMLAAALVLITRTANADGSRGSLVLHAGVGGAVLLPGGAGIHLSADVGVKTAPQTAVTLHMTTFNENVGTFGPDIHHELSPRLWLDAGFVFGVAYDGRLLVTDPLGAPGATVRLRYALNHVDIGIELTTIGPPDLCTFTCDDADFQRRMNRLSIAVGMHRF